MSSRERMIAACSGQPVDRPPVWLMRQAGRYLPEYLALRDRHTFWDMVRTPEIAVEATMQPLRRYAVDASIIFSDILVIPEAMGAGVRYEERGPVMTRPFEGAEDLARLADVDVERDVGYLADAVAGLCEQVQPDRAVIGFAGAPLTLAAYLVEGGPSKDLRHLKALFYRDPALVRALLDGLADKVADLLAMQVRAGADLVQVFDSWAGLLNPEDYQVLALPAVQRVMRRLDAVGVPRVLYLRGAASHLAAAATSGAEVLAIDQTLSLADARAMVGPSVALQGNLDPAELLGPAERIRRQVGAMIDAAGEGGYVVNLAQGVVPDIPPEGVGVFVDAVVNR